MVPSDTVHENIAKVNAKHHDLGEIDIQKCTYGKEKRRRSSLSRRVSFSAKTRVKEFHDGQHEVRL